MSLKGYVMECIDCFQRLAVLIYTLHFTSSYTLKFLSGKSLMPILKTAILRIYCQ